MSNNFFSYAYAQNINNISNSFLTYENSTYGISIKYPHIWNIDESGGIQGTDVDIVTFSPPSQSDNAILDVHQDRQDDSSNNVTAFLDSELLFYKNNFRDFQVDDFIVNSFLAGNNAYKMNYTYTDNDGAKIKSLEIGTEIGNKVYYINFSSKKTIFDNYLPIVQAMIDSFKVTATNNNHDKLNL